MVPGGPPTLPRNDPRVKNRSSLAYLWMLLGSFSFAVMSALAHAARAACDWQVIALARTALVLFFAWLLARAAGVRLVFLRPATLWMRSVAGSVSIVCTFYALTRLPISDVLTLTNMFPIWVALLSWPLLQERPGKVVWAAVASAVLGVVLIQQPHLAEGNFATLVALASSVSTAVAMIGLHRLQHLDARAIVVHFSGVGVVFCLASFFTFDRGTLLPPDAPGPGVSGAITLLCLMGIGITATLGQLFLTSAFAAGPPARVSVLGLTQVVFAMAFDLLFWHRSFNSATLLGIFLVLAPSAWLMSRSLIEEPG
jgi:drug/metabolite transporter (DMT)-like permease